ncbi:hypothetical protein [Rhodomicrobium sp.]|uniref:hypothetical protein n=1 Tax=Rhodomicrobium sp. TaxID=2720632 RepID=UPI0039E63F36
MALSRLQPLQNLLAREINVRPAAETAVTSDKPWRESDRVYLSPGVPSSAVSLG